MPYATNTELPDSIKNSVKTEAGRDIMRNVINSQLEAGKSETVAFASAWAALQRAGYKQNDEGEWIDKTLTLGDVHVPSTEERGMIQKFVDWLMTRKADFKTGDMVEWNSSGGTASGKIVSIHRKGNVPDIPVKITASEDDPAARIQVYRDGEATDTFVGHKLDTLRVKKNDEQEQYEQALIDEYASKADDIEKAEYQGKDVELNKPFRTPGESKKFAVYVRNDKGNVVIVRFGDSEMEIKRDDPEARRNFRARHSCDTATDKTSARYWSCKMWSSASVTDILGKSGRYLDKLDAKRSMMPLKYDINALSLLRPDQVPRMLRAITHPERLGVKNKAFADLIAIQNRVDTNKVKKISEQEYDGSPCGVVARFNNENYILDGHHRMVGRWLAGDERVNIYFIDLEPISNAMKSDTDFNLTADILKSDEDQRLVYGWASIIYEDGEPVTDSQGDIIAEDDLLEAAHNYVSQYREAKAMHEGDQIGEVVESLVFTSDVQKALGIDLGKVGWFIGMKISDDAVWEQVKSGSLAAFSIGGKGRRIEIDD